jgi:hypothetical protein
MDDLIALARSLEIETGLLGRTVVWKNGGRGIEKCGPCPKCGGTDRFSINTAKRLWNCRGCDKGGRDAISLAMHVSGAGFLDAIAMLTGERRPSRTERYAAKKPSFHGLSHAPAPAEPRRQAAVPDENALALWEAAHEANGTIVDRHLVGRSLDPLDPSLSGRVLRFHPACPWRDRGEGPLLHVPAMVALRRSIHSDEPLSVHRTRLTPEGLKLARQNLGPSLDTAIKLDADEDVTKGLVIGEGIETCLAARQRLGLRPVWALGSAGGIATFPVLPGIEELTILTEKCPKNAKAVRACGERWVAAGRKVILVHPLVGKDINDAIRGGST